MSVSEELKLFTLSVDGETSLHSLRLREELAASAGYNQKLVVPPGIPHLAITAELEARIWQHVRGLSPGRPDEPEATPDYPGNAPLYDYLEAHPEVLAAAPRSTGGPL